MCEKDFYENNSFIGRQSHFAPDNEKGSRDQDREVEKISQVGHTGNDRKGDGAAEEHQWFGETTAAPRSGWFIHPKEAYCAAAGSRRVPRVSEASKVSLRIAASVAHRKQVRAERAHH